VPARSHAGRATREREPAAGRRPVRPRFWHALRHLCAAQTRQNPIPPRRGGVAGGGPAAGDGRARPRPARRLRSPQATRPVADRACSRARRNASSGHAAGAVMRERAAVRRLATPAVSRRGPLPCQSPAARPGSSVPSG